RAILAEIELIHLPRVVRLAQLFEPDRTQRSYAEHSTKFCRGGRDRAFAVMMEQSLQRRRRAIDGHCELLVHYVDGDIDSSHSAENVRHQIATLKACRILAKSGLVVGSAGDIIKDRTRQASPCQFAKIIEIVAVAQSHAALSILITVWTLSFRSR